MKTEKIVEECIDRFLVYVTEYFEICKRLKEKHSAENHIKQIQYVAYLDEVLYTIKKYASKEQKLRIKRELGRKYRKFF